jgi:hypothetical protein
MGCLHALHFGAALDFIWLCATTSETTVTKRIILTASILGYLWAIGSGQHCKDRVQNNLIITICFNV